MSFRVLTPGLCSLVVDRGRPHTRSYGVPVGGAADVVSLTLGNALVGNKPNCPALEVNLTGPELRAECSLACVLFGAACRVYLDHTELTLGKTFTVHEKQVLRIGSVAGGMRCYLCVHGGIKTDAILGSCSSLHPLQKNDVLRCRPSAILGRSIVHDEPWAHIPDPADTPGVKVMRILPGAQASWFPENLVCSRTFMVSKAGNRMGLRLQGEALPVPSREMVSEPVCPGTVQVTRDGQCIILGVDGQTIGGYPKIATVISVDLDVLGQLRPGDTVAFAQVSLEEAERLHDLKQRSLRQWVDRLWATRGQVLRSPQESQHDSEPGVNAPQ